VNVEGPTTTTVAISLKMYFSNTRTRAYCAAVAQLAEADDAVRAGGTELVLLPTFPSIPSALDAVRGSSVRIGAQDLAAEDSGAFTGEVSGAELAELGCTHVEVGHAERRSLFGESDSVVAAKTQAAFRHGLTPILCVGEETRSDAATAAAVCVRQVFSALSDPPRTGATPRVIVAYEPYWAIGASHPAPTDYVAEVCERIRTALADQLDDYAIIYGGSAGPGLLDELRGSVDGLFLGRFAHDLHAVAGVLAEAAARQRPHDNSPAEQHQSTGH
jgi:triosephosphate isomerase